MSEGMDAVADALQRLADRMDRMERRGRTRREPEEEDAPESAAPRGRRSRDPLEIQGVMFQVSIPVGRRGETMPAFILLPPVRDERELEKLADEVEREFRSAKVYPPKGQFDGARQFGGHGYRNGGGGGGGWRYRDRDYRRY
jgi:hypothetical protein